MLLKKIIIKILYLQLIKNYIIKKTWIKNRFIKKFTNYIIKNDILYKYNIKT